MKQARRAAIVVAVFSILSGCATVQVLDDRLAERIRHSTWLRKEETVAVLKITRMRRGPGNRYPVIRTLHPGDRVVPSGTSQHWRAVRVGTENGFVRLRDLEPRPDPNRSISGQ